MEKVMKSFAFSALAKDFDKAYESLEDLQFYQEKGYIPYKFSDESELTEKEKSYKQIVVGGQRYFLQPPK
tara:strand:- start:874 stop:1083 length:210 start_codon:yes stop_codon:yes gene_type:complete